MTRLFAGLIVATLAASPVFAADNGLITLESKLPVKDTIEKFEAAIKAKAAAGWIVFTQIDHAAAAKAAGIEMKPRTVIVFGNPKVGTAPMLKSASLAIDVPLKAVVWQDDQGKVMISYNSAAYLAATIYPRHGLAMPPEAAQNLETFLAGVAEASTK